MFFKKNTFLTTVIILILYVIILNFIYFVSNPNKFYFNFMPFEQKAAYLKNAINNQDKKALEYASCPSDDIRGGNNLIKLLLKTKQDNDGFDVNYKIEDDNIIRFDTKKYPITISISKKKFSLLDLQLLPFYSQEWDKSCIYRSMG